MHSRRLTSLAFLLSGGVLLAQTVQTGSVIGQVKNATGAPLKDVLIVARSGQVERRATTDKDGAYRLPLLNVGAWNLVTVKAGMQARTIQVRVKINDTQTANITLVPVAEATVVVVDNVTSLDVTSTKMATNMASEAVDKMPRDRTSLAALSSVMNATPGVQMLEGGSEFYVHGATSTQNTLNVDGTSTNSTLSGGFISNSRLGSSQPPLEFMESVEVVTGAFGAEYGALGGVVNALTKSGSNTWSGQTFYSMNFPNSQAAGKYNTNWVPSQYKPAISDQYYRYGASASGPIVKDKLFFFLGYQEFKDKIPPALTGTNWNGLTSSTQRASGPSTINAKINWFVNENNQLIYSFSHSTTKLDYGHQYPNGSDMAGTLDSGFTSTTTIQTSNLTWNWIASPNLYVVASFARFQNPFRMTPMAQGNGTDLSVTVNDYRYFTEGPGSRLPASQQPPSASLVAFVTGSNASTAAYWTNPNTQYRVDLTWQIGKHEVKAGYLRQDTSYSRTNDGTQRWSLFNPDADYATYNVTDLELVQVDPSNNQYDGRIESYYVKDVFEVMKGVRLDVGLRYDPFKYWGASGKFDGVDLANYRHLGSQLQPRVGLVWDMDNNGKKKVFAHWGRFFDNFNMSTVTWATASNFRMSAWAEGTGFTYNPTYAGGTPFTLLSSTPYRNMEFGATGKPAPHAKDLKLPHKDTFTLGGDWTWSDSLSFGASWTMWEMKNTVEDSWFLNSDGTMAFDTATQKVLWNPGPGKVTIVDSDGQTLTWTSNFPKPKNRFINLNLHGQYTGHDFYVGVSYDWTHHYGNVDGAIHNSASTFAGNGEGDAGYQQGTTKDFDFATSIANGNFEGTRTHVFKLNGGYTLRVGEHRIDFTPSVTWQSGIGLSSYLYSGFRYKETSDTWFDGDTETPVLVNNQRGNMGCTPSTLITDLSVQDTFKFHGVKIVPNLAIMNIFNTRPITGRETLADTGRSQAHSTPYINHGKVTHWQPGRTVTAGISLQF